MALLPLCRGVDSNHRPSATRRCFTLPTELPRQIPPSSRIGGEQMRYLRKRTLRTLPRALGLTKLITLKLFNYARLALWMARRSNLATLAREPHGGRALDTIKALNIMKETSWVAGHRTPRRLPRHASQFRLYKTYQT